MKTLRLFTLALAFILLGNVSKAQWVSIPDTNFAMHLYYFQGIDVCLQGDNTTGWQMDTTCPGVSLVTSIVSQQQGVRDFEGLQYFDSLKEFNCFSNFMDNTVTSIPALPENLEILEIGETWLNSFPDLPSTLTFLGCSGLKVAGLPITSLPALPAGLRYLGMAMNPITNLPVLPDSLETLVCTYNSLTSLPSSLPVTLKYLDCEWNQLTGLPSLPPDLTHLYCSKNSLTALPALPATIRELKCYQNQLTSLPALPDSLRLLWCHSNNLTTLPALPNNIWYLYFGGSSFTHLPPALPDSLEELIGGGPLMTSLPALPSNLKTLRFDQSGITGLPPLPSSLRTLTCTNTPISSLPELPGYMSFIDVSNTPLTCLPQLKSIGTLRFNQTNITCLPNYPSSINSSTPALSTVPICNYFNNSSCAVYWNITGSVYKDLNNNCAYNPNTDPDMNSFKMFLYEAGNLIKQTVVTQGTYSFDTDHNATYQITVDTSGIPFRVKCPASGSLNSTISTFDSLDFAMNFALECKPGFDLEAKSVATNTIFRPANFNTLEVAAGDASNFYNGHCAAGVSGTVTLSFTGPVKYIAPAGGALTPTVAGNTLTYNIANFGSVNFFEDFDIVTQTDTTAQANQQICFTLSVTPTSGDNNPANNTFSVCYTVVNSFDPNDKQVYPSGNIDTAQRDLVYTIRFQNTGNAEAQHIYITDTLSSSINPASFQLLAYSHAPMVQLDGNKLRFNFPNINLPDSTTNEPASHGYVQFKVKLTNGLPVGTVINNTAYIYFDFNPPVVTNTTTNTIYIPAPPVLKPVSIGKYRIDRGVKPNGRL